MNNDGIVIIDYKMGNLGSISNMLKKIGVNATVSSDPNRIDQSKKLILPGVGAFNRAMENLNSLNLIDIINRKVLIDKIPVLGICLGMQIMAKSSEEGNLPGLGWINAKVLKFDVRKSLKVPHMGWNLVKQQKEHPIFDEMYLEPRFYFVHTYYIKCNDQEDILTSTIYDNDFTSSFSKENIIGVQFHPEKSHKFGMKLLENFTKL